ncbi:unnamed protein product [Ranitomeya imitator]|uniref:MIR domain-containing protein n=1 Tax=Ranitomeya imitator TaxID=111125 RepID=A0ABN9KUL9_9NEOB|nr:unnamed protein product [Ranitomeya imitator]
MCNDCKQVDMVHGCYPEDILNCVRLSEHCKKLINGYRKRLENPTYKGDAPESKSGSSYAVTSSVVNSRPNRRNAGEKIKYRLVAVPHGNDIASLFELDPTTLQKTDSSVPRNSFVRLRHLCTNTWIQSTNVPIDVDEERPIRLMLGTCPTKEDKEAFAIVSVPVSEIRDLDFANDASLMLANFVERLIEGFISQNDRSSSLPCCSSCVYIERDRTSLMWSMASSSLPYSSSWRDLASLMRSPASSSLPCSSPFHLCT